MNSNYNNPPLIAQTGSYVGNDTANRALPHGLGRAPRALLIVAGSISYLELPGNAYIVGQGTTRAVTAMNETNFYVGNAGSYVQSCNAVGVTYYWAAI